MSLAHNDTRPLQAGGGRIGKEPTAIHLPLVDRFERVHRSLRISVTDVCNIRCQYCMPEEAVQFLPSHRHLSYPQIVRFVRVTAALGIRKYRITGGEPLIRPGIEQLVQRMMEIPGVEDVALTTNGMFLADQLECLVNAGLRRVNISLDTLSEDRFQQLSRRSGLHRVLQGIEAAISEPRLKVRLNALVLRDINWIDVVELVRFAKQRGVVLRFIEFMPLDAGRAWESNRVVSGAELRRVLSEHFGPLVRCHSVDPAQPSTDYAFSDGSRVGFIDSVTQPFCSSCDRLRLTSDGKIRNCLFGKKEWDVSTLLADCFDESNENHETQRDVDRTIECLLRECVMAKAAAHGIGEPGFQPPDRAMYQIGG